MLASFSDSWGMLGRLGRVLAESWAVLGRLGQVLGRLGAYWLVLGRLGGVLEASWAPLDRWLEQVDGVAKSIDESRSQPFSRKLQNAVVAFFD